MLETIREFAQERLGDEAAALRARHRTHALRLAQQYAASGGARLEAEIPNLLQAMASAVEDGEPASALAHRAGGAPLLGGARHVTPRAKRLDAAQAGLPGRDLAERAWALELLAAMALQSGDAAGARHYADAAVRCATEATRPPRRLRASRWRASSG